MSFLKRFGIIFGSKKNKLLPEPVTKTPVDNVAFLASDATTYKYLVFCHISVKRLTKFEKRYILFGVDSNSRKR